ncbi:MAG: glutamine-hydrolyzing GMP synthase [Firmicutes bacterium]|nr:glutamine-hydrolyzing GMP synthase [Bacillota bacterium]
MERDSLTREKLIVLDLGGHGSHIAARQIRRLKVYCEIFPFTTPLHRLQAARPRGVIMTGRVNQAQRGAIARCAAGLLACGIPILALGSGLHWLVEELGGKIQAMGADDPPTIYGTEFDVEAVMEPGSQAILENFAHGICGCQPTWTMESFVEMSIKDIRAEVGEQPVVCGLSGGVDSTVAAALVYRAIGNQLTTIFVDHGFMRKHEVEEVTKVFRDRFGDNFIAVDARERFLQKVKGVTDPEEKRKRIGTEFIRVFEEEAARLGKIEYLVQGTLYPDVVESGEGTALVKSHHNVGGLPEDMSLELLEPLRWLFKDEVREVATELGLPDELVWRQPFPGPGLAVRIIGEITLEKIRILQEADYILREEIARAGLERDIWQYFVVLSDTKTVGVHEQQRTYGYMVGIRAVNSIDGMTASWVHLSHALLETVSHRIMDEVKAINRVVYDISSKPPSTIEWE